MNQYTEIELRLSRLLHPERQFAVIGNEVAYNSEQFQNLPCVMPHWMHNDGDAFRLMVDLGLKVDCTDTDNQFICYVHVSNSPRDGYVTSHQGDHGVEDSNAKRLAVRSAIVQCAILKLEAKLEKKTTPGMGF